jgi:eukaryotic-like serine/threonine-protein kinase
MSKEGTSRLIGSTLGRFQILRCIGAGGMGVVYQAVSAERDSPVAIKTLNHLTPEAIYRFKNEFRSLVGVLHPNLVQMHELSCDGQNWFFVMDYVDGVPFIDYVRGVPGSPSARLVSTVDARGRFARALAEAEEEADDGASSPPPTDELFYAKLRRVMAELVGGVNALHALGMIHRDLKPSNVLVTPAGRVVVLDFGLASQEMPADPNPATEDSLHGTPLYMAPELFTGDDVGKPADWYGVGVMLYEALVGQLPHRGAVHQLVSQKLFTRPKAPADLVPGTPLDLSDLALSLLDKDPERRPGGDELAALFPLQTFTSRPPESEARRLRAPFVGRDAELARLASAFERVQSGQSVILNVSGESGIGKSALVEAFLSKVRPDPDVLVLFGRCYEHESVPFKAFDQIADELSGYLARLPDGQVARLIPRDPTPLTTLFPVLARVPQLSPVDGVERPPPPDPTEFRLRGFAAVRELFVRLSEQTKLVLVVDDLQWADDDSALLLKEVFAGEGAPKCLVFGTSRDARPHALRRLLSALQHGDARGAHFEELELSGLSPTESRELARQAVVKDRKSELPLGPIADEAKGNPFFVLALSRHAPESPAEGTTLSSFMRSWFQTLPEGALELLRVIAVAGRPVEETAASSVTGSNDTAGDLYLLSSNHFIGAWPTPSRQLVCYHDRIREAVLADLSVEELRSLHLRLGQVLEESGGVDAEALATHFLAAGELTKGSVYAERAADEARRSLAFLHAAQWYERAHANVGSARERARRLETKLGEVYAGAGQGVTASNWYLRAAADARKATALELRQRAAELLLVSGHIDEGVAALDHVLLHIRMRLAPSPRRALASLVLQRARVKFRGLGFSPRDRSELSPEQLLRIDACWSVALGLSLVDPIRAADFQTRNLLFSLESGEPYRVARALSMEAGFRATGGSKTEREARELSERALALAAKVGHPHAIGLATFTAGLGRYLVGRWRAAVELLSRAEKTLAELPGAIWELNAAQRFQLNSLSFIGDIPTIAARVPELVKHARERGNLYAECALRVRLCSLLWLAKDDPEGGVAETAEVMQRWSQDGFHLQHYNELFAYVSCALYMGQHEKAMHHVVTTWPKLERSLLTNTQALRIEARHLRSRVCLSYLKAHPQDRTVRTTLSADIRALRRENAGWGTAFAEFAQALLHVIDGDVDGARIGLEVAEREFDDCDMGLLKTVTSYRLGQLLGGDEGARRVSEACDWLEKHQVKSPTRFVAHYAPS